jgi:membrane protease YdiL (CAAX protease family)/N-acetylglutamate synthase-like GNAT family acetyltransferase
MSQTVNAPRSPTRLSYQLIGLLGAYVGLTFALAWAAWVPAAVLFRDEHRPGLPAFTGGLVVLQTLGAAAPTVAAYLVLQVSGRRDLLGWITGRYKIWRIHPGWYLTAGLLAPAITLVSLWVRALGDPHFQIAPGSPLGEMLADLGVSGVALVFPLLILGWLPSSALLEEFGWRGLALPLLQRRWNALTASVVLGLVWGVWHLPLMVANGEPPIPYLLLIVPHTMLMTWVVNSTRGSMLLAMLFHAGLATALTTLYPGSQSMVEIVLTWLVAAAVLVRYGPRELARRDRVQLAKEVTAMCTLRLRAARRDEARLLSELALRSKGHWGYDQAFLDACRAELTLTPEDVETRRVTVAERDRQVVGFYALAGDPPEGTLADLFVAPERIGTGVGRALWEHAMVAARTLGFERLTLEADPGAEPFYLAMGAHRIGSVPSGSIPGRFIPLLEVPIVEVEEC